MANVPVKIKKSTPVEKSIPDLWSTFRSEMDRLFDRFNPHFHLAPMRHMFGGAPALRYESSFDFTMPAVDVSEEAGAYKITAELPGMTDKDVEVRLNGDRLTIKGEKRQEKEQKDQNYHVSERSYGAFERSFTLPDGVDRDKISAEVSKGVLTVVLPKKPEAQVAPKKIEVKTTT